MNIVITAYDKYQLGTMVESHSNVRHEDIPAILSDFNSKWPTALKVEMLITFLDPETVAIKEGIRKLVVRGYQNRDTIDEIVDSLFDGYTIKIKEEENV